MNYRLVTDLCFVQCGTWYPRWFSATYMQPTPGPYQRSKREEKRKRPTKYLHQPSISIDEARGEKGARDEKEESDQVSVWTKQERREEKRREEKRRGETRGVGEEGRGEEEKHGMETKKKDIETKDKDIGRKGGRSEGRDDPVPSEASLFGVPCERRAVSAV